MFDSVVMHKDICRDLSKLYERKNHDYGDSFHKSFEEWGMTMSCIRLDDKLNRIKTLSKLSTEHPEMVVDESIDDTLMDLANYAIMTLISRRRMNPYTINNRPDNEKPPYKSTNA